MRVTEIYFLGTYDLDLVLLVAQNTQKDPKEYLLFLNQLKEYHEQYRKFKIDEHLGRHVEAIRALIGCEDDRFGEVCEYMEKYSLHSIVLEHYKHGTDHFKDVARLFAKILKEKGKNEEAGILFGECDMLRESLDCLRNTTLGSLALSLAAQLNMPPDQVSALAEQLADNLKRDNDYQTAARFYEMYCDNTDEAVEILCEGSHFAEALEISQRRKRVDLVSNIINTLKSRTSAMITVLNEMAENMKKYSYRVQVLMDVDKSIRNFYVLSNKERQKFLPLIVGYHIKFSYNFALLCHKKLIKITM